MLARHLVRLVGLVGRPRAQDLLLVLARVHLAQALRALLGGELRLFRLEAARLQRLLAEGEGWGNQGTGLGLGLSLGGLDGRLASSVVGATARWCTS